MALRMTPRSRRAYSSERSLAGATRPNDPAEGWRHLERAHIVAQPFALAHVGAHIEMLRQAVRDRDRIEILGQLVRVVLAAPASAFGRIPVGNTGRARVPLTAQMPIPNDLVDLFTS